MDNNKEFQEQYPFPHCDSRVLHAPSECVYCDHYPERQQSRVDQKINFTGHSEEGKAKCPAETERSIDNINRWHGNVAMTSEQIKADDEAFAAKLSEFKKTWNEFMKSKTDD